MANSGTRMLGMERSREVFVQAKALIIERQESGRRIEWNFAEAAIVAICFGSHKQN